MYSHRQEQYYSIGCRWWGMVFELIDLLDFFNRMYWNKIHYVSRLTPFNAKWQLYIYSNYIVYFVFGIYWNSNNHIFLFSYNMFCLPVLGESKFNYSENNHHVLTLVFEEVSVKKKTEFASETQCIIFQNRRREKKVHKKSSKKKSSSSGRVTKLYPTWQYY